MHVKAIPKGEDDAWWRWTFFIPKKKSIFFNCSCGNLVTHPNLISIIYWDQWDERFKITDVLISPSNKAYDNEPFHVPQVAFQTRHHCWHRGRVFVFFPRQSWMTDEQWMLMSWEGGMQVMKCVEEPTMKTACSSVRFKSASGLLRKSINYNNTWKSLCRKRRLSINPY